MDIKPAANTATFMTITKALIILLLLTSLNACSQVDKQKHLDSIKDLSEKTGIEMLVINEAEKLTFYFFWNVEVEKNGIEILFHQENIF